MLNFHLGSSGQSLTFTDITLEHFSKHQQHSPWRKEAGGQLFAEINGSAILVTLATGPRKTDLRSKFSFRPDRKAEQQEIDELFGKGQHYIGDWHSHPEPYGHPSFEDIASMRDCVRKSKHNLNYFVLVIVGWEELPSALHISLHGPTEMRILKASGNDQAT